MGLRLRCFTSTCLGGSGTCPNSCFTFQNKSSSLPAGQPEPVDSTEWRTWMAHKIGYTTAWTMMYMEGYNPCYESILSIKKNRDLEFDFITYPNPTNGRFSIDLGHNHNSISATITDLVGRKIHKETFQNRQYLDFILDEPKGIYFVILEMKNNKSVIKIIKE
jgi:hypothetical protein